MVKSQDVFDIYEYFSRQLLNRPNYDFKPSQREEVSVKNFTDNLNAHFPLSIGANWLYQFFSYQFAYYDSKYLRVPIAKIEWVAGKKAMVRWGDKKEDYWCFTQIFTTAKDLKRSEIVKILNGEVPAKSLIYIDEKEERTKQKYYNTMQGLSLCLLDTTLINPISEICQECKFAEQCKPLLLDNYPKLYKLRYEEDI